MNEHPKELIDQIAVPFAFEMSDSEWKKVKTILSSNDNTSIVIMEDSQVFLVFRKSN